MSSHLPSPFVAALFATLEEHAEKGIVIEEPLPLPDVKQEEESLDMPLLTFPGDQLRNGIPLVTVPADDSSMDYLEELDREKRLGTTTGDSRREAEARGVREQEEQRRRRELQEAEADEAKREIRRKIEEEAARRQRAIEEAGKLKEADEARRAEAHRVREQGEQKRQEALTERWKYEQELARLQEKKLQEKKLQEAEAKRREIEARTKLEEAARRQRAIEEAGKLKQADEARRRKEAEDATRKRRAEEEGERRQRQRADDGAPEGVKKSGQETVQRMETSPPKAGPSRRDPPPEDNTVDLDDVPLPPRKSSEVANRQIRAQYDEAGGEENSPSRKRKTGPGSSDVMPVSSSRGDGHRFSTAAESQTTLRRNGSQHPPLSDDDSVPPAGHFDYGDDDHDADFEDPRASKKIKVRSSDPKDANNDGDITSSDDEDETGHEAAISQATQRDIVEGEAQAGVIESVELVNFMCHKYFKFDFGPQINFVTGPNGSRALSFAIDWSRKKKNNN